jgi:hypothetical protein
MTNSAYAKNNGDVLLYSILCLYSEPGTVYMMQPSNSPFPALWQPRTQGLSSWREEKTLVDAGHVIC